MFKNKLKSLTQTNVWDKIKLQTKEELIMKKDIKIIALIYVGVAVLTYALTLRVDRLEQQEDIQNQNKAIVLSIG